MAQTAFGTNDASTQKLWSGTLYHEMIKESYVGKFIGDDQNSLIQRKREKEKSPGDQVTFTLRVRLNGDGVSGDGTAEGNEEALTTYTDAVKVDQLRHQVRLGGSMSEERVAFDLRAECKDGLRDWWAERMDTAFFNQITGNTVQTDTRYTGMQATVAPDSSHQMWSSVSGTITADESLTSTDIFNLKLIERAVVRAKTLDSTTGDGTVPIRPFKIGGNDKFVLFLHPHQLYQLRTDAGTNGWMDIQRAAMAGGQIATNPLYTGAVGEYNGCILHDAFRLPLGINSSSGVAVASTRRAVLCGAQSAAIAFGQGKGPNRMKWVEELFDYKNQYGVSAGSIFGMKKTRFNSKDFGTIVLSTYAATP